MEFAGTHLGWWSSFVRGGHQSSSMSVSPVAALKLPAVFPQFTLLYFNTTTPYHTKAPLSLLYPMSPFLRTSNIPSSQKKRKNNKQKDYPEKYAKYISSVHSQKIKKTKRNNTEEILEKSYKYKTGKNRTVS